MEINFSITFQLPKIENYLVLTKVIPGEAAATCWELKVPKFILNYPKIVRLKVLAAAAISSEKFISSQLESVSWN